MKRNLLRIKLKVLILMLTSCGFLPMDPHTGRGKDYGEKTCFYYFGEDEAGRIKVYKPGIQHYCAIHDRAKDIKDLRKLTYEKCNSCDEFMAEKGYPMKGTTTYEKP